MAVFAISLAACQHTAPSQNRLDPKPPAVSAQTAGQGGSTQQSAQPQQQDSAQGQTQGQSTPIITLHLAQQRQEPSLVEVKLDEKQSLYALPQPVLTQTDIARVQPVTASQGTYLLLEMNERGIPKLDNITQQARGHFLLLSVQGQLVDVTQIGERIQDGRLLIATQNAEHSQAIIRLMQGKR